MSHAPSSPGISASELIRAHYAMQHGLFITNLQPGDGLVSARSSVSPGPMWNQIGWVRDEPPRPDAFEGEAALFAASGIRPAIYLVEETTGPSLRNGLTERGYQRFDREVWMVHNPAFTPVARAGDLRVIEARSPRELSDFVDIFSQAFQSSQRGYAQALQSNASRPDRQIRHFIGYDQNRAVCGGTLIILGKLAAIYNVGTTPEARGRGHAAQIVKVLIDSATAANAQVLFLQVEDGSPAEGLYRRFGFVPLFTRSGYQLAEWETKPAPAAVSAPLPALAALLGASPPDAMAEHSYSRQSARMPAAVRDRLIAEAQQAGIDPAVCVVAGWACLWMRYSGEETALVAVQLANGRFAAVNLSLDPEVTATAWLKRTAIAIGGSTAAATATVPPNAEVLIAPGNTTATSGLPLEIRYTFDDAPSIDLSYRAALYGKDEIGRIGAHLVRLVGGLVQNGKAPLRTLELLTPPERQQLLVEWNQADPDLFHGPLLTQMFESQVERTPLATALIFPQSQSFQQPEQLTYRQLNRRANQLAHFLQGMRCGPETMVGICLDRSVNMIVALLAVWKCGAVCVPLDPAYPPDRLKYMIDDTKAPVIVTQESLAKLFANGPSRVVALDRDAASIAAESEKNLTPVAAPENSAYVIYTSGSTGNPKGVVITLDSISAHCRDAHRFYGLSVHDRVLQFSSFNFDAAYEQILPTLTVGAALVMRDTEVWNIKQFAECLEKTGLTVADIPTAYWAQVAREWAERPEETPANRLRMVIVGGEALPADAVAIWHKTPMANVRLVNAYGPTEATITATAHDVAVAGDNHQPLRSIPIGRPRGGREMYVLDRWMNPLPINVPGELHIGGRMLARGYLHRPELTAQKFIPNPFNDDPTALLYKTGDLVRYLPDGSLDFLGRLDDQVKIRGFRIELGELESALREHPDVTESVALARQDESGEKRLVAYCRSDKAITPSELRRFLRGKLPEYMVPSAVVVLKTFPLLPSGKIDRRALPAPDKIASAQPTEVKGPVDPLELQLQLVFERVLKRAPIGVDASFFELGGDSLQALELLVEIERGTGRAMPLGTLYQASTIEALAALLRQTAEASEFKCLVPLQRSGTKPPLYLIHTTPGDVLGYGGLIYHLGSDQPCYGIQSVGLGNPEQCQTDVREMAAHYVTLLKAHQPEGPYYLGGWCYGGVVAVEMARLLQERGDKIAILALFETVAMPAPLWNIRYHLHRIACFLRMSPQRWAIYVREKIRYHQEAVIANRMRFRQIDSAGKSVVTESTEKRLAHLERVYNANLAALDQYRSRPYAGKVTLFNAEERDVAIVPDPQYGWVGVANEIEIHNVPGNHDTMLAEPHVSGLARELKEALERARAELHPRKLEALPHDERRG